MKKLLTLLALAMAALFLLVSCGKTSPEGGGSGSSELRNTVWKLDNPKDAVYYGAHVIYTVTLGKTNEFSFNRNVDGTDYLMSGTYDYKGGKGTAYLYNKYGEDQSTEYRLTFSVSGNTLNLNYSLRTVVLTKQ